MSKSPTHLSNRLRRAARNTSGCARALDGSYSFILPFAAVTTLTIANALNSPVSAPVAQILVPGLLAGLCGMALYKGIKSSLRKWRGQILAARPNLSESSSRGKTTLA